MRTVTTLVWVTHLQERMRLTVNIAKSGSWVTIGGVNYSCHYTGIWRTEVKS